MNEPEFLEKWHSDKPIYEAWGDFVLERISTTVESTGFSKDSFFKVPASYRLKSDESLLDKAFYRLGKNYIDPYTEIEDKVGVRLVVLLLTDLEYLTDIIKNEPTWKCDECRNFLIERDKDPLLFTYQSVHFVLRPRQKIQIEDIDIPADTPCEVQIRTLLQHAHAELTHDAIYKSKRTVIPKVQRTVAKSMALIETTDDFFVQTTKFLNDGKLEEFNLSQRLDSLYTSITGRAPHNQKSTIILWDTFEKFIDEDLFDSIENEISKISDLSIIIDSRYNTNAIYRQSVVLFIYWMLKRKTRRLVEDWPLSNSILQLLANDLGISLDSN